MSLRAKLLLLFAVTVAVSVALVAWIATASMRRAFEALDAQRTSALVAQFRQEFSRRGEQVTVALDGIAKGDTVARIALEAARSAPDYSPYVNQARGMAEGHQLDFLELVAPDGTIISSAQWPARFGYKEEWLTRPLDWKPLEAFLDREELPDGAALGLVTVRTLPAGEGVLYVVGGLRLDRGFLKSLVLPEGMRAMLYRNTASAFDPQSLEDASGSVAQAEKLAPLIQKIKAQPVEASDTIAWSGDPANSEMFQAIPLKGRHEELLGVLLVGRSRQEMVALERRIRTIALIVGGGGVLFGLLLSGWAAARVTKPVEQLASAAAEVAGGNWDARVEIASGGEIGRLAKAFNQMTEELAQQRDRLVQAERVAAWRELARRLAHELKNPLFPLQITIENLLRAREQNPEQFEEVFRESTATLLAELANLKTIIGRFSDFAKMPPPQFQSVDLNQSVLNALKLFEAQFAAPGRPPVTTRLELAENTGTVQADPSLLHRAVSNLILNALDAMPSGGTLTVRTRRLDHAVRFEISDTGSGLTREECERLFTPYYTTKQHGTGLGLAIVQSVVSDHHGRVSVDSEPGRGTTFCVELPCEQATKEAGRSASV
ncbi:MAG: ATP-binding protein [Terriglobales bacterium]